MYFLFSATTGALILLRPILMIAYQINGLGITYRVLGETISTVLTIYSQALAGYVSDRLKSRWGQRKPVMAIGVVIISVSCLLLSLGVNLSYRYQACFFLLFSATSSVGEAFFTTCGKAWLFEITSGQDELLRALNYYAFPGVVVGFLIITPFTYIDDLRLVGVLIAVFPSICTMFTLFSKCRIGDNRKAKKQEAVLATVVKLLSNPFTEYVWIINLITNAIFGFLLFSIVITLNYTIVKTVADTAYFGIAFGIGFTVFFCIPLNYVFTERIKSRQWPVMSLWKSLAFWSAVAFITQFTFAATLNYRFQPDPGAVAYILTTLIISCLLYLMQQTLVVCLRKGCMVDLHVRGINSFSLYSAVVGMAGNIINALINAVIFVVFSNVGYKQNDDDYLDDHVSERYDFNDLSMWYIISVTTIPPAILCYGIRWYAGKLTPLYDYIDNDGFESQSEAKLISSEEESSSEDIKKTVGKGLEESLISSPMHLLNKEDSFQGRTDSRADNIHEALLQFTDNELACLSYHDVSKRDSYKAHMSYMHYITLVISITASVACLYFAGICIMKGYSSVTIIVLLFVLNSLVAFYEVLKHKSLANVVDLYGSRQFEEAIKNVIQNRERFQYALNNVFPNLLGGEEVLSSVDDVSRERTHMTRDKTLKMFIALFCTLSCIVLIMVIATY